MTSVNERREALSRLVLRGKLGQYYSMDVTKLCLRPYAVAVMLPVDLWEAALPYLQMPMAQLSVWRSELAADPFQMWVAPIMKPHAKWGLGGAVTSILINAEEVVEFRIGLPQGSATCKDFVHAVASLAVLMEVVSRRIGPYSPGMVSDRDEELFQLFHLQELTPDSMTVVISPRLLSWLRDSEERTRTRLFLDSETNRFMEDISDHLGVCRSPVFGKAKPTFRCNFASESAMQFAMGRVMLEARKPEAKVPDGIGYKLTTKISEGTGYAPGREIVMVASMLFLCAIAEMATREMISRGATCKGFGPR